MEEIFGEFIRNIIIFWLVTDVIIPIFIGWLVIKYIFRLRQRQNEQFLYDLGYVIQDAVSNALENRDIAKKYEKTTRNTYSKRSND